MSVTCEVKQAMYREERNAFIAGMGLFLFLVLHRLVDIQDKLHKARESVKLAASAAESPSTAKQELMTEENLADSKKKQ